MEKMEKLIIELLSSHDIMMVPFNPNPSDFHKELFDYFSKIHKKHIYLNLINFHTHSNFENALNIVKHAKGKFNYFDETLDFKIFLKIEDWLDIDSINNFKQLFYHQYALAVLNDEINLIDDFMLEYLFDADRDLFFNVAVKLKLQNISSKVFNKNPEEVFDWLNKSNNVYNELVSLNQPDYIFDNMNGKLDITEQSIKYIIDYAEIRVDIFLNIKREIGLEKLWHLSKHKFRPEFYVNVVETLNELLFIINIDSIGLESIEHILILVKDKFPLIYENFNSLLFLKK